MPLCELPLLAISVRKDFMRKQRIYIGALVGICVLAFMKTHIVKVFTRFFAIQGTVAGGANGTEIHTFSYILKNPLRFLEMFVNTIYTQSDAYMRNVLGGSLSWNNLNI